jgi:hypothetical protein
MNELMLNAENALFNLMHSFEAFEKECVMGTDMLAAYDRFATIRSYIEQHPLDNSFLAMYGKELVGIAPSIFNKDRKAVVEELTVASETYTLRAIAHDVYTFILNLIKRVIDFIKRLFIESRRVQAGFIALRKSVDLHAHIDTRTISYGGYAYDPLMRTLADNGGMFAGVPVIDKATAQYSGGYMPAFRAFIEKQMNVLKITNTARLFDYDPTTYRFSLRSTRKGYASLDEAGIRTSLTLFSIIESIESNLEMVRKFEPIATKFKDTLEIMKQEAAPAFPDATEYAEAHYAYISTYMSTVPPLVLDSARVFMRVMRYIITPDKESE